MKNCSYFDIPGPQDTETQLTRAPSIFHPHQSHKPKKSMQVQVSANCELILHNYNES